MTVKQPLVLVPAGAPFPGGAPIFEIRDAGGMTDMLIRDNALGDALAFSAPDTAAAMLAAMLTRFGMYAGMFGGGYGNTASGAPAHCDSSSRPPTR